MNKQEGTCSDCCFGDAESKGECVECGEKLIVWKDPDGIDKICPGCGVGIWTPETMADDQFFFVRCECCHAQGPISFHREACAALWNQDTNRQLSNESNKDRLARVVNQLEEEGLTDKLEPCPFCGSDGDSTDPVLVWAKRRVEIRRYPDCGTDET